MPKMYEELADWWHLISTPEEYIEEVAFFMPLLADVTAHSPSHLLELGSGGGNNALYMKKSFTSVTLIDLSPHMLESSRKINPDCDHLEGDMRTVRLGRTFDAVFVHDAIDYMTTLDDLRQALETAYIHCKAGGITLFVPDNMRESYEPDTDHGGSDGDGRSIRYLEWSYDPDESDTTVITDYVFVLRDGDQPIQIIHDQHVSGLFALADWLRLLHEVGFTATYVIDTFERYVFVARKPLTV